MQLDFLEGLVSTVNDAFMNLFHLVKRKPSPRLCDPRDNRSLALEFAEPQQGDGFGQGPLSFL